MHFMQHINYFTFIFTLICHIIAVLGPASYINITILSSDDAYGVFSFANSSLNTTVTETSSAVLSVVRMIGSLGTVRVSWELVNGSSDFSVQNGSVTFISGQTVSQISIPVVNDAVCFYFDLVTTFSLSLLYYFLHLVHK